MKVPIDRAGRLVIPKDLRELVGLVPGADVEISVDGAGLRIESAPGEGFIDVEGFMVIPPGVEPLSDRAVRDLRLGDQA